MGGKGENDKVVCVWCVCACVCACVACKPYVVAGRVSAAQHLMLDAPVHSPLNCPPVHADVGMQLPFREREKIEMQRYELCIRKGEKGLNYFDDATD